MISYLNVIANPRDNMSFERIVNEPKRGVGPSALEKLRNFADMQGKSLAESTLDITLSDIRGKAAGEIYNLGSIFDLRSFIETSSITELVEEMLTTGYMKFRNQANPRNWTRIENIEEFLSVTKNFDEKSEVPLDEMTGEPIKETGLDRLSRFLNEVSLLSQQVDEDEEASDAVTMMTLHAAKGCNFRCISIGMEENIFPLSRVNDDPDELEEERRLAYVGITRAEEFLYMTNANQRVLYGKTSYNRPSRFISEIDDELLDYGGFHVRPIQASMKVNGWRRDTIRYWHVHDRCSSSTKLQSILEHHV